MKRRQFLKTMAVAGGLSSLPGSWLRLAQDNTPQFFLPPTVQHVTENSAVIYFWLNAPPATGSLLILKEATQVREVALASDTPVHQIFVDGLEPATTYQYQVVVNDLEPLLLTGTDWTGLSFQTPPYEWPLRLTALGDTGFGDDITLRIGKLVAQHDLDLFLHLGDVVYFMHEYDGNTWMNWAKKYFEPFQQTLSRVPHYPTFGNHELDDAAWFDGMPSYFWVFPPYNSDQYEGRRWYSSFDLNGIQFLSLNSQLFYSYASYRNAQEAWLDEKLARPDVQYTVAFFHIPPYTSASLHQWDGLVVAENWMPKFEANHVVLALSGHAHVYERLSQNGVHYLTAGSASSRNYAQGETMPNSRIFLSEPVYPIIELYEDHIHLTSYNINDEVIEDLDLEITPRF
jgi:predicted phosphodiesterase